MAAEITGELPGLVDHRFSRATYQLMVEAGIFTSNDKLELIGGWIVAKSPQGFLHVRAVPRLDKLLQGLCGSSAEVFVQMPYPAGDDSMPEPDLYLTRPGAGEHSWPDHALLVIEVADSSLQYDRATKSAVYAATGVAEYWVVDVRGQLIEVYREPRGDHYGAVRTALLGDSVDVLALPGVAIGVDAVVGERVAG